MHQQVALATSKGLHYCSLEVENDIAQLKQDCQEKIAQPVL